jgi:hypothetical protein
VSEVICTTDLVLAVSLVLPCSEAEALERIKSDRQLRRKRLGYGQERSPF